MHISGTEQALSPPTIKPTLDLNFAATKALDPRIEYYRYGPGSYIDENGEGVFQINREINVPNYKVAADIKKDILEIVKSRKLYRKT